MPRPNERPAYADSLVREIGDKQVTHMQVVNGGFRMRKKVSEAGLRSWLRRMSELGILDRVETGPRTVEYKVSQQEKDRCLNLAREANPDCKEWIQGLLQW